MHTKVVCVCVVYVYVPIKRRVQCRMPCTITPCLVILRQSLSELDFNVLNRLTALTSP